MEPARTKALAEATRYARAKNTSQHTAALKVYSDASQAENGFHAQINSQIFARLLISITRAIAEWAETQLHKNGRKGPNLAI